MGFLQRIGEKGGDVSRLKWVGAGIVIGFFWGSVMWLITGAQGNAKVWLYLAITMAMIGGGVAGIAGAISARKKGERISPRLKPKDDTKPRKKSSR